MVDISLFSYLDARCILHIYAGYSVQGKQGEPGLKKLQSSLFAQLFVTLRNECRYSTPCFVYKLIPSNIINVIMPKSYGGDLDKTLQ